MMNDHIISTDKSLLDPETIWELLKDQYWSKDIPIEYILRFIKHSLCFGIYQKNDGKQIGFARVITDYTTYAYICDVVIADKYQRQGLGKNLMNAIMNHPELQGLKAWALRTTEEARKLYESFGFSHPHHLDNYLEIEDLDIYQRNSFINLYRLHELKES